MKSKNDVDVLINGRKYTLCGFESADYIQKVATYINSKLSEFQKKEYYANMDIELKNILLAINIADDYFKVDRDVKSVMKDNERKDKMVLEMKHKILEQETAEAELKEQMEELRKTLETSEKKVVELNVINQENVSKANEAEKKVSESEAEKTSTKTKLEAANEEIEQLKKIWKKLRREKHRCRKNMTSRKKNLRISVKRAKKIWQMQKQNIRRMARN